VLLKQEIFAKIDAQLNKLVAIKAEDIKAFNQQEAASKLPALTIKE